MGAFLSLGLSYRWVFPIVGSFLSLGNVYTIVYNQVFLYLVPWMLAVSSRAENLRSSRIVTESTQTKKKRKMHLTLE